MPLLPQATDRRAILQHISACHPGKPKMVSVAKKLLCVERKANGWQQMRQMRDMQPPPLTLSPALASSSGVFSPAKDRAHQRGSPSPAKSVSSASSSYHEATHDGSLSPVNSFKVKSEVLDIVEIGDLTMDPFAADDNYIVDEHGVRRRQYVPMSERQGENYRCRFCTFIARDQKRLSCHERSHGMPPTKRERFKCMFCPQGFDSELKFRLHITCHPGLIKLLLYKCKKCEFDSNQKHSIIRHITCNRDRKHRGVGPVEDQYSVVSRTLETRVLQCEQCNYMTRHKIHMAIHYREHGILRDKSEFNICGLTPHDIPLSSYETNDISVIANHVTPELHDTSQNPHGYPL